jgi:hypothetical protein
MFSVRNEASKYMFINCITCKQFPQVVHQCYVTSAVETWSLISYESINPTYTGTESEFNSPAYTIKNSSN